jgi:hypothetical protein
MRLTISRRRDTAEPGYARKPRNLKQIETEFEREIGPEPFAQLRRLLVQLNATDTVCEHHRRPPTTRSSNGSDGAEGQVEKAGG